MAAKTFDHLQLITAALVNKALLGHDLHRQAAGSV